MITKLTSLKRLGLEQTSITDTGMAWVAQLPKLEALNLNYTPVSDTGIALLVEEHRRSRSSSSIART